MFEQENRIIDRIMMVLMQESDQQVIKGKLTLILDDYDIKPKEKAIVPYSEGKNEMLLRRFLLAKAVAGCSPRTIKQYEGEVRRVLNNIGKDADQITTEDIQVYIARLMAGGKSKTYCDNVRRDLSSFYGWLHREEIIMKNPMNRVEAIKFHREKEPAFTDLEIEMMREKCANNFEKAMFETLLSTGCRASELCSIKICDIKNGKVEIFGKGGKYRNVYINAKASVAISAYLAERTDMNPYLFPGGKLNGGMRHMRGNWYKEPLCVSETAPYGKESVNCLCRRIAKRAGVTGAHAHRFRRTCATHALRHGMPIEMVSMMLGHEQISTTQIYLDINEDDLRAAHKKYVI